MTYEELEDAICKLIEKSITDRQSKDSIAFELPQKTIDLVWKKIKIDLRSYECIIHGNEIRHIQKEHPDDLYHICKVPYHLMKIAKVKKTSSYNRDTKRYEPALTFEKFTQKGKLSIVKLHISRDKILSLKTLFEEV